MAGRSFEEAAQVLQVPAEKMSLMICEDVCVTVVQVN